MFSFSSEKLTDLADFITKKAIEKGATDVEVDVHESVGREVGVHLRETENIEYQQSTDVGIGVFIGHKKGFASTSDLSSKSINQTIQAAIDIARFTQEDNCIALADKELMANKIDDLDLYHEWDLSVENANDLALCCENAAFEFDKRIVNSESVNVYSQYNQSVYANTNGFCEYEKRARHGITCVAVSQNEQGMQQDSWYDTARLPSDLLSAEQIGQEAARKAVAKLSPRKIKTGIYPILFDRTVSGSLIGHLVGALSGGVLYQKRSFLNDSIGKKIFPDFFQLKEEPHIPRVFNTSFYDDEGVATSPRQIIQNGIVNGYFLSSYSARKLKMQTTANAGGAHRLELSSTVPLQQELLRQMGTGLLITDLMGQGVNILTGDYSRGANGFWIENGVIAYPVDEITIAGNLRQMFKNIVAIANDAIPHATHKIGSILLSEMTVASNC